jgi:hypothetical protein
LKRYGLLFLWQIQTMLSDCWLFISISRLSIN